MRKQICIIDDDAHMLNFLGKTLSNGGTDVQLYDSPAKFFEAFQRGCPDVVVLDLLMPEMSGIDVLREIRTQEPLLPVVMLTSEAKVETAVRAMKEGVDDYITKPIDVDEFRLRVLRALEIGKLREKVTTELEKQKTRYSVDSIVGNSKVARKYRELVLRAIAAPTKPVWLIGESGGGKHYLCGVIHYGGNTAENNCKFLQCAHLPASDAEEFFFGSVIAEGTAHGFRQRGAMEQADGGTLVLENPEFLPGSLLKKLCESSIHERIVPTGAGDSIVVKTRLIFLSDVAEPQTLIADFDVDKEFVKQMEDRIYYISPLTKRSEDVEALAHFYLQQAGIRDGVDYRLSEDAVQKLCSYNWPGNIRELNNALDRSILLAQDGNISAREISLGSISWTSTDQGTVFSIPQGLTIKDLQGEYVRQTLEYFQGNLENTAASLGISRKTLWEIRKKFQLP